MADANPQSPYWQHREPLSCPQHHVMVWLGSAFWICGKCRQIYVVRTIHHGVGPVILENL
jgi:hypothetical protein